MSKPAKPAAAATGDQAPPKSKKMLIIIIALVVLLAGGGAAAYFLLMKPHPAKHDKEAAAEEAASEEDSKEKAKTTTVELGEFVTNLAPQEEGRHLRIKLSAELAKPELEEKLKEKSKKLSSQIITLLSCKHPEQLDSTEGKKMVVDEVKQQLEYVLDLRKHEPPVCQTGAATANESQPGHEKTSAETPKKGVVDVFYTDFLIQ